MTNTSCPITGALRLFETEIQMLLYAPTNPVGEYTTQIAAAPEEFDARFAEPTSLFVGEEDAGCSTCSGSSSSQDS